MNIEAVTNELSLSLIGVQEDTGSRKYEEQAKKLIYRIPIYRPTPFFIINLKDLSLKVKIELVRLNEESLDDVMKEAIGRIFEQIDQGDFLSSVRPLLHWKLV